jgi:hypothetical protein
MSPSNFGSKGSRSAKCNCNATNHPPPTKKKFQMTLNEQLDLKNVSPVASDRSEKGGISF